MGALLNKNGFCKFVNITFLIVKVWSQDNALSHLAVAFDALHDVSCYKCLNFHTIVADDLDTVSKYEESEASKS